MIYRTIFRRELITPIKRLVVAAIVIISCLIYTEAAIAACGCTDMTLKYRNAVGGAVSTTYCVNATENFSECTEVRPNPCGAGKKGWECPIGGQYGNDGNPWIGVGFEVVASIPNNKNLNDCTYGQGIQRNITENGTLNSNVSSGHNAPTGNVTYTNVNAQLFSNTSTPMPHIGDTTTGGKLKLASDNYTMLSPTQTIDYSNNQLRWSDFPAVYVDGDTAKNVVVQDRFITFIRDKQNGTVYCACKFLVQGNKNAGGDILNAATLTQENSYNCTFSPQ